MLKSLKESGDIDEALHYKIELEAVGLRVCMDWKKCTGMVYL